MVSQSTVMDRTVTNSVKHLIENDVNVIIGLESATEYWNLSTFISDKPIIIFTENNAEQDNIIAERLDNTNTENVVYLSKHLRVTDLEQTVIDMVRYNRHEFHLYETLISAIHEKMANIDRLNELAKQYGVYEKMYQQLEDALIAEQEDAEQ